MPLVALVDPAGTQGARCGDRAFPNIGLAHLSAALQAAGFAVSIVDCNNDLTEAEGISRLREERPDVVCISIKTATLGSGLALAEGVRRELAGVPVLFGGVHATLAPATLPPTHADLVFRGEGEIGLPTVCSKLVGDERAAFLESLPKTASGVPRYDAAELSSEEMDNLPLPDYSQFSAAVRAQVTECYPLVTSRGCPYKCIYCSVPKACGHFRSRSPENVLAELRHMRETWGIRSFEIIDDAFNVNRKRAQRICELLIDGQFDLPWTCPNGIRSDLVDAALAEIMAKSGCHSAKIGVESGDPEVFARIAKGCTLDDIDKGILALQGAGIEVGGFFIIGLPGDSMDGVRASVAFARKRGLSAHFNLLVPYPETHIWDWVHSPDARLLRKPEEGMHFATGGELLPVFDTPDFSAADRLAAYEMANTCMGELSLLLPPPQRLGYRRYYSRAIALLWRHCPQRIPGFLVGRVVDAIRRRFFRR